jgi:tRNA U55 pseudouridine synthase TruB
VALRRTRVGSFGAGQARTLDVLAAAAEAQGAAGVILPLAGALQAAFPVHVVSGGDVTRVGHGTRLPWPAGAAEADPLALLSESGDPLALARYHDGLMAYLVVFS